MENIMKLPTDKDLDFDDESFYYFAHPWINYSDKKIHDYLKNNRHLTNPEVYEIFKGDVSFNLVNKIGEDMSNIFSHCYSMIEDIPNVKWITSFEKNTECIQFDNKNTIVLDFAQISEITEASLNCQFANEDLIAKYDFIQKECAKILGKEFAFSKDYDTIVNDIIDIETLSNTRITYALVNRNISDVLFCNGCLDGAFHYCSRATAFQYKKATNCYIRPDSFFGDSKIVGLFAENSFYETSIFLTAHEAHHIELRRQFSELPSYDRWNIPNGLFERLFNWFVIYGELADFLLNDIWHRFGFLIEERCQKIIDDLREAFSCDSKGSKVIDACEESILAWGNFKFDFDITKMTDDEYNDFLNVISECYCDIMALYDLLNAENAQSFVEVSSIIGAVIRIMTIQETNYIANELIKYMNGKINKIHSINILRLQLFFFAVINESMVDDLERHTKFSFHNNIDWINPSEAFSKAGIIEPLLLGIFKSCSEDSKKSDFQNFYQEMFGDIDSIHEYYYKPTIFEIFHVYQDGFVCDECNSVYIKSKGIKLSTDDYENGFLVTNLPSIIINNNIKDTKDSGIFYQTRDKKTDEYGQCITDTAPLSKIARIMRTKQLSELFASVRTTDCKELFDKLKIVDSNSEENTKNEKSFD